MGNSGLKNLLIRLRKYWILIVVITVLGGVAGGGYAAVKNRQSRNAEQSKEVQEMQKELDVMKEYSEESVKLRINPLKEYKVTQNYQISSSDTVTIRQYINYITTGALYEDKSDMFAEKISMRSYNEIVTASTDGRTLTVVAIYDTETGGKALAEAIRQGLEAFAVAQNDEITLLSQAAGTVIDTSVTSYKASIKQQISTAETNIAAGTAILSMSVSKYAIAGLVAGCAVILVILSLIYLMNGKIKSTSEIEEDYGIPVLAVLNIGASLAAAAAKKVQIICGKTEDTKLLVAGEIEEPASVELIEYLKKENIAAEAIAKLTDELESVELLGRYKQVLIVQHINQSAKKELDDLVRRCRELKIQIIGAVVIE